jgi:glutathione-regulated potassium-efflux system ancillary protein KefC
VLLAQGGEFGFVVYQAAEQAGAMGAATSSLLVAVVALSMLLTPLLLIAADRITRRYAKAGGARLEEISEPQSAPVIMAGFGRYGQIVGRLLFANGIQATVLEHDADQVETLRKFGWNVYYGDATRLDLLRVAGADAARLLVVAVDDMAQSLALVDLARAHFPHLSIVARARNVQHWVELSKRGVEHIERETFDSALMSGRSALEALGFERHQARTLAMRFRHLSTRQLHEMLPHYDDRDRLVSMAKAGRQQLEELFAKEREGLAQRRRAQGWRAPGEAPAADGALPAAASSQPLGR